MLLFLIPLADLLLRWLQRDTNYITSHNGYYRLPDEHVPMSFRQPSELKGLLS